MDHSFHSLMIALIQYCLNWWLQKYAPAKRKQDRFYKFSWIFITQFSLVSLV